jgi:hypothetical protein
VYKSHSIRDHDYIIDIFVILFQYFQRKLVDNSRIMLGRVAAWLMLPRLATLLILLGHVLGVGKFALKGLSHEMDLPFHDIYG